MEWNVYEWDFVKHEGVLKHKETDLNIALYKARKIAESFCEDKKPLKGTCEKNTTVFFTDCDFGAIVKLVKED